MSTPATPAMISNASATVLWPCWPPPRLVFAPCVPPAAGSGRHPPPPPWVVAPGEGVKRGCEKVPVRVRDQDTPGKWVEGVGGMTRECVEEPEDVDAGPREVSVPWAAAAAVA